mgnify:FL=1
MSSRPLKSLGNGALQELTLSDEDYLAYRAGIHLSTSATSDVAVLSTDNTETSIGSFSNTEFSSSGTISSTTHTLGTVLFDVTRSGAAQPIDVSFNSLTGSNTPTNAYVGDTITFTTTMDTDIYSGGQVENLGNLLRFEINGIQQGGVSYPESISPTEQTETGRFVAWREPTVISGQQTFTVTWFLILQQAGDIVISSRVNAIDEESTPDDAFDEFFFNTLTVLDPSESSNPEVTTTNTTIYQNLSGTPTTRAGANWRGLVQWDKTLTPPGIKEMDDAELDILV